MVAISIIDIVAYNRYIIMSCKQNRFLTKLIEIKWQAMARVVDREANNEKEKTSIKELNKFEKNECKNIRQGP